jgi:hypothetical protein
VNLCVRWAARVGAEDEAGARLGGMIEDGFDGDEDDDDGDHLACSWSRWLLWHGHDEPHFTSAMSVSRGPKSQIKTTPTSCQQHY